MIYVFEVHIKPGHTAEQYADAWVRASKIIQRAPGAHGTRLHRRLNDPTVLLAIATREELTGSTITVTSLGALGGIAATPVINSPEVAIIGPNKLQERPVVRDGEVVIRTVMNVSSSFDHRIVDGFVAARFVQEMKQLLESPAQLMPQDD